MRRINPSLTTAVGAFCALLAYTSTSHATPSRWATQVGLMLGDTDKFLWCRPSILPPLPNETGGRAEARFAVIPSDASDPIVPNQWANDAALKVRTMCLTAAGGLTSVTSSYSLDSAQDRITIKCPPNSAPSPLLPPQCMIDRHTDAAPSVSLAGQYVYRSSDCGQGVSSLDAVQLRGQMTGPIFVYDPPPGLMTPVPQPPLYNETWSTAGVWGTDEGASYLAHGKLHFLFGDTYNVFGTDWRSNVVAYSTDFNPGDADGVKFSGWDFDPASPNRAREVIASPHVTWPCLEPDPVWCPMPPPLPAGSEWSGIPLAGAGLTDAGGNRWRFHWLVSIHEWVSRQAYWNDGVRGPPYFEGFTENYSTLAYSVGGTPFVRLTPQDSAHAHTPSTNFGPGAIWFDRYARELYFFGIDPIIGGATPGVGRVRLAKVPSTPSAILDPAQYLYWNGTGWSPGVSQAVDILPPGSSTRPRSEISVAYDAYAGRWLMMLLDVDAREIQLWQSPEPELFQAPAIVSATKPWTRVPGPLPVQPSAPDDTEGEVYGPMMSEHLMTNGGEQVYFLLSQWQPIYEVHLWRYHVNRLATTAGFCASP